MLGYREGDVFEAELPPATEDFEFHLTAGNDLIWPPTAPGINQTVVVEKEP